MHAHVGATIRLVTSDGWTRARDAFDQAVGWFMRSVPEVEGRWEELALGEWSVRDLVGHTSRAMLTVEAYLGTPASEAEVTSAVEYFRRVLASSGDPAAVAQRGRDAGAALGEDPASAVREISERVLARLHAESGDALLTTPAGGMRLLALLSRYAPPQPWWLGYLDTGADDIVFPDAPPVTLYAGWSYVLVEASTPAGG